MPWQLKSDRPIYIQLIEHIKFLILSGEYPLGSKLPSVRDLAGEAAVNPNTMQRALVKLEEDGFIITHRTSGRSVTEDAQIIEQARTRLAQEQIKKFLDNMKRMGFDEKDILSITSDMLKEFDTRDND